MPSKIELVYIQQQMESLHRTQKWVWGIFLGFSIVYLTRLIGPTGVDIGKIHSYQWAYLLGFIFMVCRFYILDTRITDHIYISVPKSLLEKKQKDDDISIISERFSIHTKNLTRRLIFIDSFGRSLQSILLALAAYYSLTNTERFFELVCASLMVNAAISLLLSFKPYDPYDIGLIDDTAETITCIRKLLGICYVITALLITAALLKLHHNLPAFLIDFLDSIFHYFKTQPENKTYWFIASIIIISGVVDLFIGKKLYFPNFNNEKNNNNGSGNNNISKILKRLKSI